MFAKFFIIFFAILVVLGVIGLWMKKRGTKGEVSGREDPMSEKNVDNVNDLNDLFNRARYMDRDDVQDQG